jgi:Fe-S cluster assembly iron-binding protein IscA
MLTLTENASTAVHDLTTSAGLPETGGLRIAESDAQSGGFELALVPAPAPEDEVVTAGEATVFLAPGASASLSDLRLDVDSATPESAAFALVPQ